MPFRVSSNFTRCTALSDDKVRHLDIKCIVDECVGTRRAMHGRTGVAPLSSIDRRATPGSYRPTTTHHPAISRTNLNLNPLQYYQNFHLRNSERKNTFPHIEFEP